MSEERVEDKAHEGLEHLQAAALELIAAMRAFLDVAEDVVREPAVAATIVHAAAGLGRTVLGTTVPTPADAEPEADEGRVRHIHVS